MTRSSRRRNNRPIECVTDGIGRLERRGPSNPWRDRFAGLVASPDHHRWLATTSSPEWHIRLAIRERMLVIRQRGLASRKHG